MKILLLFALMSPWLVQASHLRLITVKQPIYLHGSDNDVQIQIADVIVATFTSDPEAPYDSISASFVPPSSGQYKNPPDVNLASAYGIKTHVTPEGNDLTVTIDASSARVPEGYPFTIAQVIDAVTTCVKMMTPIKPEEQRKFTLRIVPSPAPNPDRDTAAPESSAP